MRRPTAILALVTATLTAASCDLVLEINVGYLNHGSGTGGLGGTGGASFCTSGEKQECYTGPDGTKGQGICKAGEQTCNADGSAFGDCVGEQLPMVEDCATAEDDDCDGNKQPCSGTVLWAKRFGDGNSQFARGVAVDPSANVLLTGSFLGSVDFSVVGSRCPQTKSRNTSVDVPPSTSMRAVRPRLASAPITVVTVPRLRGTYPMARLPRGALANSGVMAMCDPVSSMKTSL